METQFLLTMQLLKVLFSLLVAAACVFAAQPPTELQIETTFMPEECPEKAAKGDTVFVHYVSSRRSVYCSPSFIVNNIRFRLVLCLMMEPSLTRGRLFYKTWKYGNDKVP